MISMILQLVQQSNVSERLFSELMMYCAYSVRPQMYFLSDYTKLCSQIHVWSHYSPKRAECLKEVQLVLDLPEVKTIKPSDTRWLAHKCCVKTVKGSYSAIVNALNNIYEQTHEPEALGISKVLCKPSSVSAIYLLDYALP